MLARLLPLAALLASLGAPAVVQAQEKHCGLEATCVRCHGVGRAYSKISGLGGCVVCWGFCPIILEPLLPNGETGGDLKWVERPMPAIGPEFERLFVQANEEMVRDIAQVNPEAAVHLAALSHFSAAGTAAMTMVGDGTYYKLHSTANVDQWLARKMSDDAYESTLADLPAGVERATVRHQVVKKPHGATMLVSHRLYKKNNVELDALYPDVQIVLKWVSTGKSGYWAAVSWQLVTS